MELVIKETPNTLNKSTICLNMIVKNESEIIVNTLKNLCQHIKFDYWVIADTGSTDNTKEVITKFFEAAFIPGEIVDHEWKDFAYNRTKALEAAFNKTDYLLIFDADDSIEGKLNLPEIMDKDRYNLKFGKGFEYLRPLLITNRKIWCFKGVLHEYLQELEAMNRGSETIQGDYYIISGRFGNRSKNPNKYYDDAIVLKNAFDKEMNDPNGNKGLAHRYAFYCAQSYKDTGNIQESINWYKKVLELNNWAQEKYYSCLMLGELYKKLNDNDIAMRYWIKSSEYDSERIEGIVDAMEYLRNKGDNLMVNLLYEKFKNYSKNLFENKLFIDQTKYNDLIEFNNSVCAYYISDKSSGYECCKKIIMNNTISSDQMNLTLSNIMFYKDFMEKDTDKTMYNRFILKTKDIQINEITLQNDIIINPVFSKELCKQSKNVLFYTGFSCENWNYSYMKTNSLGGSEKAIAHLSTYFPKEYTIYISGGVENEHFDNITYIHLNQLQELINSTAFHTIICSRYIGFLEMYKNISFYQFYMWAHDISMLPYGCNLTSNQIITKWDKHIDGCICQTKWHADEYKKIYPELKDKISIINNGIDTELFTFNDDINNYTNKKNNKFIYTSRVERGLKELLELWPQILSVLPNATLVIANYVKFCNDNSNSNHMECKLLMDKHTDSVTHLGQLNSEQLYCEMSTAEYWLYPTAYHETSCITALEMLMSGVICMYYPVAGLVDTMKDYGLPVEKGNEISTLINLTFDQKKALRVNGITYAKMCSWENRAKEWTDKVLANKQKQKTNSIKIINLKRREDRKNQMLLQLNKENINIKNVEFIEAVDGKTLEPTLEIKNLFNEGFTHKIGVVGCALSHYNLWTQLIDDIHNDYYIIMEDDIVLCNGFKQKIEQITDEIKNKDLVFIGYHKYSTEERKIVINEHNEINETTSISVSSLNKSRSGGGTFCYSINKNGAKKYIEYIKKYKIHREIDWFMLFNDIGVECYELYPLLVISSHPFDGSAIDTDIQYDNTLLEY